MSVTAAKAQLIVKLQKIRHPHCLPGSHETGSDLSILFGSLRFNVNLVAEHIHHVEGVKFAIAFYVPWADKIGLVDVVDVKRFGEIRVLDAFGDIRSFF